MAEYISRDKVLSYVYATHSTGGFKTEEDYLWLQEAVVNSSITDVQPICHGRWIGINEYCKKNGYIPSGMGIYYWCSECGKEEPKISDYCPNCGARMDGDTK